MTAFAFSVGVAEHLPYPEETLDLVVITTSFDDWSDQLAGLRECARVLAPGGRLVLADQFSLWLAPTLVVGRRGKARTKGGPPISFTKPGSTRSPGTTPTPSSSRGSRRRPERLQQSRRHAQPRRDTRYTEAWPVIGSEWRIRAVARLGSDCRPSRSGAGRRYERSMARFTR
jgi:SAM-dependent methyltransferase